MSGLPYVTGLGEGLSWASPGVHAPCRGTCVAAYKLQENFCGCWVRAVAFGGADALFPKCPSFPCIPMCYVPCPICSKHPFSFLLHEKVILILKLKTKGYYVEKVLISPVQYIPYIYFSCAGFLFPFIV